MSLLTGLVEYHKLDTDYSDATGNGNTANNSGTTISAGGILNSGADFSSTYIRSAVTPGSEGTVAVWFKYSSFSDSMIIGQTKVGVADYIRVRYYTNTDAQFNLNNDGGVTTVPALGTSWHHVVIAWDSLTPWTVYQDGSLVFTGSSVINPSNIYTIPFGVLSDGAGIYATPFYFNGKMDEIGIWNRRLSAAEVTQLYGGGTPPAYPLVASVRTKSPTGGVAISSPMIY